MTKTRHRSYPYRFAAIAAVCILIVSAVIVAKVSVRKIGVKKDDKYLLATFSYRDVFSKSVREKLRSGLPTNIVIQVGVESKESKKKDFVFWARTIDITYDLWEEVFVVVIKEKHGKRRKKVKTLKEAIDTAGILWRARVARLRDLEPGVYRLRFLAEVNPVSKGMVKNIQRWISQPQKGRGGGSQSRTNFFGAFVGRFVDKNIGKADKTVVFLTQWFRVGSQ